MRNGLSHQLSSLSCALGEAYYTGRTLLLPRSGLCSSKGHVARWAAGELPLDVWALDMNWRNTSAGQDRYYDH